MFQMTALNFDRLYQIGAVGFLVVVTALVVVDGTTSETGCRDSVFPASGVSLPRLPHVTKVTTAMASTSTATNTPAVLLMP